MRSSIRNGIALFVGCFVAVALRAAPPPNAEPAAPADVAIEKEQAPAFDSLMERVRRARESGDWKQPGWKDAELERSLDRLVEGMKAASGRRDFSAGAAFADVRVAGPAGAPPGRAKGEILVVKDLHVPFADGSIILSDGSVKVSHATGCTIIARGVVQVSHGRGNLIVAGYFADVSHDASSPGRPGGAATGSVIVAGQRIDVSHANGSVLWSPGSVRVSHAGGVTFVSCPDVQTSHENNCQRVELGDAEGLAQVLPRPGPNPLEDKLKITQVVPSSDPRKASVLFDHGGVEVAARIGAEVRGADGKVIDGLQGWTLSCVGDDYALFASETGMAGFIVDGGAKR
jgi:hypothetical protein